MKLLFSFIALSILSFQAQAQVLIEYPINQNMDLFDWEAFINKETIQQRIDFENKIFNLLGPDSVINGLNLGKSDLARLEQELELYKQGIKQGLSSEEIQQAEEAIKLYRDGISSIENTILEQGFNNFIDSNENITPTAQDYLSAVKELYQGDHKIIFDMVEKNRSKFIFRSWLQRLSLC